MRRFFINLLMAVVLYPSLSLAGGIVTNTNQSASFIRKPVQDAVIDATGTYYNPAGLVFLEEGFHLSLSNQTISQTRTITSTFPGMARTEFEGGVSAPLFPTVYAVYKTGDLAFSFGVNPIGGGGSATFDDGLPSFEQQVAVLPPMLSAAGIGTTQYSMNAAFDGSSLNWGIQVNASYAINEMIGVSAGVRYVIANNSYTGHLRDVRINPMHPLNAEGPGNMISAPVFFSTLSAAAGGAAQSMQPIIDGGGGIFTLDQLVNAGFLTPAEAAQLAGGLGASYNTSMTAAQVQEAYNANAALMGGYAQATSDMQLDASQSGSGIVPVVGLNIKFSDDFNVALKYEHKASITMTNSTTIDDVGMYPDGLEVAADMPAMLAVGASYRVLPQLRISGGVHYYFDKSADYGKSLPNDEVIDNNFWEAAFGFEYALNRSLILSAGYLRTQTGVNDKYHSDLSHSLSTNSIGGGAKYMINPNLGINVGVMSTMYEAHTKSFTMQNISYNENYDRVALTFAIGVDVKF
ncbi:MAG: aromatic hydrocarbon degradation protein [Bacteroidetes bacterium]|nr:MAG: aromatic hydrocarbon degradation protein [Bacteroidota bacterium]